MGYFLSPLCPGPEFRRDTVSGHIGLGWFSFEQAQEAELGACVSSRLPECGRCLQLRSPVNLGLLFVCEPLYLG